MKLSKAYIPIITGLIKAKGCYGIPCSECPLLTFRMRGANDAYVRCFPPIDPQQAAGHIRELSDAAVHELHKLLSQFTDADITETLL